MAGFGARALASLRDPWSLVVASVGAGSAWAVGLPLGAAGVVGVGMLGVAAVVGGAARSGTDPVAEPVATVPLRPGTVQAGLVTTLHGYRVELERIGRGRLTAAVRPAADAAVDAARTALSTAERVARAVDAVDDAAARAQGVARQMPASAEVRASVQRLLGVRQDLLGRLSAAVGEVGEVYAKLLELSTTAELVGLPDDGQSEAAGVNDLLDAVRGAFAELENDARASRRLTDRPT